MSDIKITIGADIKELEQKLAVAKAKLASLGQEGPKAIGPLQQRLSGLTFPTDKVDKFGSKFGALGGILKSTGFLASAAIAGIGLAVAGASKWFDIVKKDFISVGDAAEKSAKKIKEYKDIVDAVIVSVGKETTEVVGLLSVLNNETETRERKLSAIKELQKIQPEVFKNLKLEGEAVLGLDEAYKSYISNLKNVIAAKIIQAQIEAQTTELLRLQGAANTKEGEKVLENFKKRVQASDQLREATKALQDTKLPGGFLTDKQTAERINQLNTSIKGLFENLTELSKTIKVKEIKVKPEKLKIEKPDKVELPQKIDLLPQIDTTPLSRATGSTIEPNVIVKPKITFINDPENDQRVLDAVTKMTDNFRELIGDAVSQMMSDVANDTISALADGVADALSGGQNVVPRLFDNIIKGIGQQIKELGQYLVKIGIQKLAIDKAIKALGLNPAATIALGFAAQVLGALLINAATKKSSSLGQGFASGTTGVQEAGFYNINERGAERVFLPRGSKVQPNNEVQAFGGGGVTLQPSILYEGTGFRIMLNRVDAQMGRNN